MSRSGTRRNSILNRRSGQKTRVKIWLKRLGLSAVLLGSVAGAYLYADRSGWVSRTQVQMVEGFHGMMKGNGFAVANVLIDGRKNVDRNMLKDVVLAKRGQSIFEPDLSVIQKKIEGLSWVKAAVVERHLPDTLYIRLEERQPMVLWQQKKKLSVVDADGHVLATDGLAKFRNLLIVVGDDAPDHAPELVRMLSAEPHFASRVESAKWIGGRRWDLFLKNGVEIRLPEEDMGQAIKRLAEAQNDAQLMDRDVLAIDLRDPSRIVVQTAPGQAEDYQASFKKQKNI